MEQILPYILGGGAITAIIAALRWGRQDASDSAAASSSNTAVAMSLRDEMRAERDAWRDTARGLETEVRELRSEVARLVLLLEGKA